MLSLISTDILSVKTTCMNPPWQYVPLTNVPNLNFLNLIRRI